MMLRHMTENSVVFNLQKCGSFTRASLVLWSTFKPGIETGGKMSIASSVMAYSYVKGRTQGFSVSIVKQ